MYSHFVEPLPPTHSEFKRAINKLFPEIYDTKFIVNHTGFVKKLDQTSYSSSLDSLYQIIKANDPDFTDIKIKLAPGFESYDMDKPENATHFHEAGFDAFLTGLCFAKMFYKLHPDEVKKTKNSVNVMKSFKYLKMNEEIDPYYNENILIFFISEQLEEDTEKLCYTEVLAKLECLNLGEDLRIMIANTETHNQAILVLETLSEEKKNVFAGKVWNLEQEGFQICTFEEQCSKVMKQQEAHAQQKASKYVPNQQYKKPYNHNQANKPNKPNAVNSSSPSNAQFIPNKIPYSPENVNK